MSDRSEPGQRMRQSRPYGKRSSQARPTREILDEPQLADLICRERRRSDRSRRPFLLLLLQSALLDEQVQPDVLEAILRALGSSTRDTDTLGWYKAGEVLGVLFTEIDDDKLAARVILGNVLGALNAQLGSELADRIGVSFHVYPESARAGDALIDRRLYPDMAVISGGKAFSRGLKRGMDIVISALALVLLSPLLLLIAAAIKLTSRGPVLFKQTRVGKNCRKFTLLKFRSMYAGNDARVHQRYVARFIKGQNDPRSATFKLTNDARVTLLGRLLRRSSLDELPQFLNVLRGDMSVVGPRPPLEYELRQYEAWHRRRMMNVRPGITGLWQVKGRSRTTFDEMVRLDLQYIARASFWFDLKIMLQTPAAMFSGKGAY